MTSFEREEDDQAININYLIDARVQNILEKAKIIHPSLKREFLSWRSAGGPSIRSLRHVTQLKWGGRKKDSLSFPVVSVIFRQYNFNNSCSNNDDDPWSSFLLRVESQEGPSKKQKKPKVYFLVYDSEREKRKKKFLTLLEYSFSEEQQPHRRKKKPSSSSSSFIPTHSVVNHRFRDRRKEKEEDSSGFVRFGSDWPKSRSSSLARKTFSR